MRSPQPPEDPFHFCAAALDGRGARRQAVPIDAERAPSAEQPAVGAAEPAQGDDVALASRKFTPGWIRSVTWRRALAFESSSAQIRCRRRVRALITTIGWRRSYARAMSFTGTARYGGTPPACQGRDPRDDGLAGAEPVGAVVVAGVDRGAAGVARHHRAPQREPPSRWRPRLPRSDRSAREAGSEPGRDRSACGRKRRRRQVRLARIAARAEVAAAWAALPVTCAAFRRKALMRSAYAGSSSA